MSLARLPSSSSLGDNFSKVILTKNSLVLSKLVSHRRCWLRSPCRLIGWNDLTNSGQTPLLHIPVPHSLRQVSANRGSPLRLSVVQEIHIRCSSRIVGPITVWSGSAPCRLRDLPGFLYFKIIPFQNSFHFPNQSRLECNQVFLSKGVLVDELGVLVSYIFLDSCFLFDSFVSQIAVLVQAVLPHELHDQLLFQVALVSLLVLHFKLVGNLSLVKVCSQL